MSSPSTYAWFQQAAESLLVPLVALMREGRASLPLEGRPSVNTAPADRFEAYARPALLAGLWLQSPPRAGEALDRERVARWFREALVMGTDPEHAEFWGRPTNFHQIPVEMAILAMTLDVARRDLWEPLSPAHKAQVARWLATTRASARHWNNHLFFIVLVLEFLAAEGLGEDGDLVTCDYLLGHLRSMHQGGGWFVDGTNETVDYYNAYAFHTYGLYWAWRHGHRRPDDAAWWRERAAEFLPAYARLFAASGENVPFGRSLIYRFNAVGAFGLAALNDIEALPWGEMRRLCARNVAFFLGADIRQHQGCLSMGWTNEFPDLAEPYSCPGSPYWAAKGLTMLLVPPDHRFWADDERPLAAERGDGATPLPSVGLVVRSVAGESELLNAGARCSQRAGERFGIWKWGRLAYRTSVGWLLAEREGLAPLDAQLTAEDVDDPARRFGRQVSVPRALAGDHMAFSFGLGEARDGLHVIVDGVVWWRAGWLLALHRIDTNRRSRLRLGSFALGASTPHFDVEGGFPHTVVRTAGRGVAAQALLGFKETSIDARTTSEQPRRHLYHEWHACPVLGVEVPVGEHHLAALIWAGTNLDDAHPWRLVSQCAGAWELRHPMLGAWQVAHPLLPAG